VLPKSVWYVCILTSRFRAGIDYIGLHHVGLLVENIDRALEFYIGTLGKYLAAVPGHGKRVIYSYLTS
jgi:hypothetical protein